MNTEERENQQEEEKKNLTSATNSENSEAGLPKSEAEKNVDVDKDEEKDVSRKSVSKDEVSEREVLPEASNTQQVEESKTDSEEQEGEQDEEEHDVDYSHMSKAELVDVIKELAKEDNFKKSDKILKEIKPLYDEILDNERQLALEKFLDEGGEEADFEYKLDELDQRFDANYQLIKDRKSQYYKQQELQREENLKKKNLVLNKLRELVDGEETVTSMSAIKEIQEEWKAIGQVAPQHAKSLWANYSALIDRFYDNRSIYFELKELDRKKNLEAKLELCQKAEKLSELTDIRTATKELNQLHEEFKHIGPVPMEEQEPLWQRFKAASDTIYHKRKEYVKELKKDLEANLEKKKDLIEAVKPFLEFQSDRIKAWNQKTKEILEIQKKWEAIGGIPRESAKEVNRNFWNSFKKFFSNKQQFFKELEKQREENLAKKQSLVDQAKEALNSDDLDKSAELLKGLQRQWKEIGPVPEKKRDAIYHEFKATCDEFFNKLRANNSEAEVEYQENLEKKMAICKEIEQMAKENPNDIGKLKSLEETYSEIGFVPKNMVKSIKEQFSKAVEKYLEASDQLSETEKSKARLMTQLTKMKAGPNANRKLNQKEFAIRKKITDLQNDITLWKNNLEFFASSKQADKLKADFESKITEAQEELKRLKEQLKIVRSM